MKFVISESVKSIKAYEAGKPLKEVEREYHISNAVKLASNENPFGFSDHVQKAVMNHIHEMNRYPEPAAFDLTAALAGKYKVAGKNIVIGNGSDDIIALLAHGFLNPGDEALMPLPSFLMYEISVKTAKGVPVMVPLIDFSTNLEGILDRVTEKTKMIFITNPFNPTGAMIDTKTFQRFADKVPENVLIIADEAYIEFARNPDIYNSLERPLTDPRIVTLRTFSKAYGLAGFRVGYGIMDAEVAAILQRIRQPFNVNGLAQVAALAALNDEAFLDQSVKGTHAGLDFLNRSLAKLGIKALPTQSNFLMMDLKTDATAVFQEMLKLGVVVRSLKSYGFETFLRVNVGTRDENQAFVMALKKVLNR